MTDITLLKDAIIFLLKLYSYNDLINNIIL